MDISSDCPYCQWTDFCGCSWYHAIEHVKEEHPKMVEYFEREFVNAGDIEGVISRMGGKAEPETWTKLIV